MSENAHLLLTIVVVLATTYVPTYLTLRLLRGDRLLALALAPALAAGVLGVAAVVAGFVGIGWSLPTVLACELLLLGVAWVLRRLGLRLPHTELTGSLRTGGAVRAAPAWLTGAAAVALVPIVVAGRRADVVLERWDTLYHLSALQRIRETGDASSLAIGSVATTSGAPGAYPGAFHAMAAAVPGAPVPVVLNGAVLALSVVPWVLGMALLAKVLWPRVTWGPFAAALVALLAPASPWNLWIHLSPVPNLVGFAMLPGVLAAMIGFWQALLRTVDREDGAARVSQHLLALAVLVPAGTGLGLLHPNVAVTALILLAVLTVVTGVRRWRRHPWLIAVPVLSVVPIALLVYTPLAAMVTTFSGGLQVPWWSGFGEIVLGLHTVWPMALGIAIAALWWPGLVRTVGSPQRWLVVAWLVLAVLYMDASVDSPLGLSILYYRGQDRLAVPLMMLCCVLVVPGVQWVLKLLRGSADPAGTGARALSVGRRQVAWALVLVAVVFVGSSVAPRLDNAYKNLADQYEGRGRFLQADELAAWEQAAPGMDKDAKVLASPFSGASHMYSIHGQQVYFPVAGIGLTDEDRELLYSVSGAEGPVPHTELCERLEQEDIGYLYQEWDEYSYSKTYHQLNQYDPAEDTIVFETDHSRLVAFDCGNGS